jgi:hypothetical protein
MAENKFKEEENHFTITQTRRKNTNTHRGKEAYGAAMVSVAPSDGAAAGAISYNGDNPLLPKVCIRPSRAKHIGDPITIDLLCPTAGGMARPSLLQDCRRRPMA